MEKIYDDNILLAIVIRRNEWKKGLNFVSQNQDFIQVGMWKYEKGKKLLPHKHLKAKREVLITQEVLYVRKGRMRADFYSGKDELVKSMELEKGDILICLSGGHGYQILKDDTEILEVKNGPYIGPKQDRKRLFK